MKVDTYWIGRGVKRSDGTDYFSSYMDSSGSDVQMGRTQTEAFKISHRDSTIHANPAQTRRTHRHALTHGEWSLLRLKFYSLWSASLAHMQSNWRTGDSFPINSKDCWLLKWKQRITINDKKPSTTQSCCRRRLNLLHLKKSVFHECSWKLGGFWRMKEKVQWNMRQNILFETVCLHILLKWFIQIEHSVNYSSPCIFHIT